MKCIIIGGRNNKMNKYPNLVSPIKIGALTLKNRIMSAPTSLANLSPAGHPTRENIAYYRLRAQGGASVVTVGDCIVQGATGKSHPKQILMDDPDVIPSLVDLADAIKRHGAVASIELDHGGRLCAPEFVGGFPIGPSAEIDANGNEIREMSVAQIEEIADAFATAAATAKLVGFDMCTLHAGHGWLICQFLSPLSNKRTDEYGGSLENRARFMLMVIERVRQRCGPDFPIEIRISGSELTEGGYGIEEGVEFAKMLDGKVDLIHVSAGTFADPTLSVITHPSMFLEHGCNVYLAAEIKKHVKTPVATVGGITDPAHMEEIIASGKADIVALARALIADPYLPKKVKAGRDDEIRPCHRCLECQGGMFVTGTMRCSVNPIVGREFESQFVLPSSAPKKVLIAGGGPSGMQAAITAAERGHDVTLCEKTDSLGGALKFAEYVTFKDDLHKFRRYLEHMVEKAKVEVRLNTPVTPELVKELSPDVLIAAVGAEPIIPQLPGIDGDNVILATDIHNKGVTIGDKVVIIGGGLVGCETGLHLAQTGKDVTIIEMLSDIARDANVQHRTALMVQLSKYVKVQTGTKGTGITGEGVLAIAADGAERLFKADTIIVSVGLKPLSVIVGQLRETAPDFLWIGDCVKPQKVTEAVRTGYDAALEI